MLRFSGPATEKVCIAELRSRTGEWPSLLVLLASRKVGKKIRGQTGLTQLFWRQRHTSAPEGAVLLWLYRHE